MGQRMSSDIKERVIIDWLQAKPRNAIASEMKISPGSVSNIIAEVRRKSIRDIDLLRDVAVLLRKKNLNLTQFASSIRLKSKLDHLQISDTLTESFIEKAAIHCFREEVSPAKFFSQISSICFISDYYDIPLEELSGFIEDNKIKNKDET